MFHTGHHASKNKRDYAKASLYYSVAAESEHSAVAMFALAYMHEYGYGVPRDLFLAKRYYDDTLVTNPEAYLPVNLALARLWIKMWIFGGAWVGVSDKEEATDENVDIPLPPPALEIDDQASGDIFGLEENEETGEGLVANIVLGLVLVYMLYRYGLDWVNQLRGQPFVAPPAPRPAAADNIDVPRQAVPTPSAGPSTGMGQEEKKNDEQAEGSNVLREGESK